MGGERCGAGGGDGQAYAGTRANAREQSGPLGVEAGVGNQGGLAMTLQAFLAFVVCAAAVAAPWEEGVPLQREGAALTYAGQPFAAVAVNKHELLAQYLVGLRGETREEAEAARSAARRSLQGLEEIGVTVIRVRVSAFWPAEIEDTHLSDDPEVRQRAWAATDRMLDDCDEYGIRVVGTIAWHLGGWADLGHESLREFFRDPYSAGRGLLRQWIADLVGRYADRDTILFWELTNEANLGADLGPQFAQDGVLQPKLERPAPHLVRGPVVRDGRNNYSSDELAALTRELCTQIKLLDREHLIGTGFSAPRPAAWHLWLGSIRRTGKMDWTVDSPQEQADYLRLITPEGVDLVSLHAYDDRLADLWNLKLAADSIGVPVYIGEFGSSAGLYEGRVYDSPEAVEDLRLSLEGIAAMRVPLTLLWTWDEWGSPAHEPVLHPDTQPEVVRVLKQANEVAVQGPAEPPVHPEQVLQALDALQVRIEALKPRK